MTKKTKKELEADVREYKVVVWVVFFVVVMSFALTIFATHQNTQLEKELKLLQEDYEWLEWNADSCFRHFDTFKSECSEVTDCIFNSDLEGCSKNDCNTCCGDWCTLTICGWEDLEW